METGQSERTASSSPAQTDFFEAKTTGEPLVVSIDLLDEDSGNPRTEFPDADLDELAEDILQNGSCNRSSCTPPTVEDGTESTLAPSDCALPGEQGCSRFLSWCGPGRPIPTCRWWRTRSATASRLWTWRASSRAGVAGDSNATIAKRIGMNLTAVAHHLALLDLPPELDQALKEGRCTSPRTLHDIR